MTFKTALTLAIALTAAQSLPALAETKDAKLHRLAAAQGLYEMYDQSMIQARVTAVKIGHQVTDQMLANLNPNSEYKKRFANALNSFLDNSLPENNRDAAIDAWAKAYGPLVSDSDIDQMIVYYTSEVGKKDVAASKVSSEALNAFMTDEMSKKVNGATTQYMKDLSFIATECKCAKSKK